MALILARRWSGLQPSSWMSWSRLQCYSTEGGVNKVVVKKRESSVEEVKPPDLTPVSDFSGIPQEQLDRVARIYVPAKNVMQSGNWNTREWRLDFEAQERWENPLMGWTSSADPLSNISGMLKFRSSEEAIAFAVKSGWRYSVEEPKKPRSVSKSYGANFSWDKKTRVGSK